MMHHHSIWVEDRPSDWPTFDQVPPFFLEYRLVDVMIKAFFLNAGLMFGSFMISPMLERIDQTSPLLATTLNVLLLTWVLWVVKAAHQPTHDDELDAKTQKAG